MRVSEILGQVLALGHHGDDAAMREKALGWVNAAYAELLDEVLAYAPAQLQRVEEVATDVTGVAGLSQPVRKLLVVADAEAGRVLPLLAPHAVVRDDPAGVAVGAPIAAYGVGQRVQVHPAGPARLRVVYVPAPNVLAESEGPEAIWLPESQHRVLVWGALVWSALFERGLVSAGELNLFGRQWVAAKESVKLALLGGMADGLRVKNWELV